MKLPVLPPVEPMLAKLARQLPEPTDLVYEPKWDGFRCIVFRDGDEVELGSRNERPSPATSPSSSSPSRPPCPPRAVVDGEIVIAGERGLDFDALLQRIHPAASRVDCWPGPPRRRSSPSISWPSATRPAAPPFRAERPLLEKALASARAPVHLTPATTDPAVARDWFSRFEGAGLDGVVAKASTSPTARTSGS
jgi:ATP-dependent DNA ligase